MRMPTPAPAPAPAPAPGPFFLPTADGSSQGQRFCIHHPGAGAAALGQVLYVHPWAEEMNKARRMAALQSRALAAAGFEVLQIDLHGCGDSSGDFADATWDGWVADVVRATGWLRSQAVAGAASPPLWLWGLRAGALLATAAAERIQTPCRFLFWQPSASGKTVLQQFLRLKAAADMQQADDKDATKDPAKNAMARLREDLSAGRAVDVAGYRVAARLALGLEASSLNLHSPNSTVLWLETSTREEAELLPASATKVQAWREAGHSVHSQVVPGPAFWQTQEIEDAPALISATVLLMQAHGPGATT
jgi:uncharacterized protein